MKSRDGQSQTGKTQISNKNVDKHIMQVVRSTIRDLREIERKSNKDLDTIVEKFTGFMIGRLEGGEE